MMMMMVVIKDTKHLAVNSQKATQVKVVITLWSSRVTVGNQGRDDRYIRLWLGNISLPDLVFVTFSTKRFVLSWRERVNRLSHANNASGKKRHCIFQYKFHLQLFVDKLRSNFVSLFDKSGPTTRTMYSNVRLDILKFSFHQSSTKSPCKRLSTQNWFRGHAHARLARLVFLEAICSKIFPPFSPRCCNINSLWNLDVAVRAIKK